MKYKHFLRAMLSYQKAERDLAELGDMGFDFFEGKYNLSHTYIQLLESAIKPHYGKDGWEWCEWYMWENDWGEHVWTDKDGKSKFGATDKDGNPIAYSLESLWSLLETDYRKRNE